MQQQSAHKVQQSAHFQPQQGSAQQEQKRRKKNSNNFYNDDDADRVCRSCLATSSMKTDWAQGDRVCTNCGVVDEQHLRERRPDWREYSNDDDYGRSESAARRCGMIPNDESKYLGGLPPTSLSKFVFGTGITSADIHRRKRLMVTNQRLDHVMEKQHKKILKRARLSRLLAQKRAKDIKNKRTSGAAELGHDMENDDDIDDHHHRVGHHHLIVQPDHDELIQQEDEEAQRLQTALYAEKWSLERAIALCGRPEEQSSSSTEHFVDDDETHTPDDNHHHLDLIRKDVKLKRAAEQLYQCYDLLQTAATTLSLPEHVTRQATHRLLHFVTQQDGLRVNGIATNLSQQLTGATKRRTKQLQEEQKTLNSAKQSATLASALLFLTARQMGVPRSIQEVSGSIRPIPIPTSRDETDTGLRTRTATTPASDNSTDTVWQVQPKHTSRGMQALKQVFVDFRSSLAVTNSHSNTSNSNHTSIENVVQHATKRLQLPPVAMACTIWLVRRYQQQKTNGRENGVFVAYTKLSTVCGAMTYFVCHAGEVLQSLAATAALASQQQVQPVLSTSTTATSKRNQRQVSSSFMNQETTNVKQVSHDSKERPKSTKDKKDGRYQHRASQASTDLPKHEVTESSDEDDMTKKTNASKKDRTSTENDDDDDDGMKQRKRKNKKRSFDVFSSSAIEEADVETKIYQMRRYWDAWKEQVPWSRSLAMIEQSCGISQNVLWSYYQKELYPQRQQLLEALQDQGSSSGSVGAESSGATGIKHIPLASVLLPNVMAASPFMRATRGKVR